MKTHYDEEKHEYYVDDILRPSVTEICEPISFKRLDALQKSLLKQAKARGSRCHEIVEQYWYGGFDEEEIETEYAPYIKQFLLWVKTYRPTVLFSEYRMFDYDFCGTCDLICKIDSKTILVDFKFTSAADKKSLSVQLEGDYRLCQKYGVKIDECYYLHIKKDSYTFKTINRDSEWFDLLLKHNKKMKEKYNG